MKTYNKQLLMEIANGLRKQGFTLSESLKRAWHTLKLKSRMAQGNVSFFYLKEDGTERFALGCYAKAPQRESTGPARKPNPMIFVYYDLFVEGWRSCRVDRLLLDTY